MSLFHENNKRAPGLFHLLLGQQGAHVHGVAQLHVRQLAGHSDGCVPDMER